MKTKLKKFGFKLIALSLLVIMLTMYPVQVLALGSFFQKNFTNTDETDEVLEEVGNLEWRNVSVVPGEITKKFSPESNSSTTISIPSGTAVLAPSSGTVVKSEWNEIDKYIIQVKRSDEYTWTISGFINQPIPLVGNQVMVGQEIGYVGTNSEIHIKISKNGVMEDPESLIKFSDAGISRGTFKSGSKNSLYLQDFRKTIYDGDFFYKGIPEGHFSKSRFNFWKWLVNFLFEIVDYVLGLIASVFNLGILGWVILAETLVTNAFDSLVVKNVGSGSYRKGNVGFYTDSKRTVNIENILFNRVEVLNVNFFESKEAVKQRLLKYSPTGLDLEELHGENLEEEFADLEDGPLLIIKDYFALIFIVLYALGLLLLLVALLINAIMAAVESVAMKKATYKKRAMSWLKAFVEMLLLLVYMIVILEIHTWAINFLGKYADQAMESMGGSYIQTDMGRNYTIMETLRTRAYSIKLSVGVPATIMYTVLMWYTFKFLLIYVKRFLVVFLLSLLGPLLMIYDLMIRTIKGKSSVRTDWIKEYTFNVLIQVIQAFVYLVFIPITYILASESIIGFIIMFVLLKFLLEADKLIRQVFNIRGAKKHSTLDNVLEKSSFKDYAAGFAVASILTKNIDKETRSKFTKKILKPFLAAPKTIGSAGFRGAYNLSQYASETRRRRRAKAGLPVETARQEKRREKKQKQLEEIMKLQGYSEKEIADRMDPNSNLAFSEQEKDRIRLIESSKIMKTKKLVKGYNQLKYTSNRYRRVLEGMSTVEEGRRRIKGRTYSYDFDEGKIKLSPGLQDKFRDSVIKEFKMGKGKAGREEYQKTISDFKKAGKLGLQAVGATLFFPISFADSGVPTGLYFGLMSNFQFNSKIMQIDRRRARVVHRKSPDGQITTWSKRDSIRANKQYRKTNREIYDQNRKNLRLSAPGSNRS